jgi:hypothetical protein
LLISTRSFKQKVHKEKSRSHQGNFVPEIKNNLRGSLIFLGAPGVSKKTGNYLSCSFQRDLLKQKVHKEKSRNHQGSFVPEIKNNLRGSLIFLGAPGVSKKQVII